MILAAAVGWAAAAFAERCDRMDGDTVVSAVGEIDLLPVLDAMARIEQCNLVLITLLAFLSALVIMLLLSGGWGNG